jgi:non-specific serine/threonine protein kinase
VIDPPRGTGDTRTTGDRMIGRRIAHYLIEEHLGEGGMGIVYAARDEKLHRPVALKVIRTGVSDPHLRERFWREARAAAALNHPGICQVHDVRDENGELVIVMERLEGETLAERLARAPLELDEAVRVGLATLEALGAVHARGFVHRDVKPSNVFLLADGRVKLLDFGLVVPLGGDGAPGLTMPGTVMGSPRTMAPEQVRGAAVDPRTDVFSVAAVLYEAVTGRPAFDGESPVDVMFAVLHHSPPALDGSPAHAALGRVLARALDKAAELRYPDAAAMASDLRAVSASGAVATREPDAAPAHRLAVLPFRMLREDPDLNFLGPSLADAIALSLAGLRSLVVRSTVASARHASEALDLPALAAALDVDAVLVGTILPAGGRCRVAAQLVQVPGGRVLWSQTTDATERDVFELQDLLSRRIVDSLHVPLNPRERAGLDLNKAASATAYQLFLRANEHAMVGRDFDLARTFYRQAIEADPGFAPAWARLGRVYRILGKYDPARRAEMLRLAEQALARALELNAELPVAHHVRAQLDLDMGRVEQALERLLGVVARNPNDPEGYAGLVTAFRYAGMIDDALRAHRRARELDPAIPTTVMHVYYSLGDYERALAEAPANESDRAIVLTAMGRMEEAIADAIEWAKLGRGSLIGDWASAMGMALRGQGADLLRVFERFDDFPDPEGWYYNAGMLLVAGVEPRALEVIVQAMDRGYFNVALFRNDRRIDRFRDRPEFVAALGRAEARHRAAVAVYGGRL